MRRKPSLCKTAMRGRLGFVVCLSFAALVFVLLYYAWSSIYPAFLMVPPKHYLGRGKLPNLQNYGVGQQLMHKKAVQQYQLQEHQQQQQDQQQQAQRMVLEQPPRGLTVQLEMERDFDMFRRNQAIEDQEGEDRWYREKALKEQEEEKKKKLVQGQNGPEEDKSSKFPYQKVNPEDGDFFRRQERLVHLDLKGAAPKVSYLEKLFPVLKSLGATGLLMEYEDTFPYSGNLSVLAADNSYSKPDLQLIQSAAQQNGLKIIPLVQTFGHMEFVLKHDQFKHLREHDIAPHVISPAFEDSYKLIDDMVSKVLQAHPDAEQIHLGCDEVYGLGEGRSAAVLINEKIDAQHLFLRHVVKVASYIKNAFPKVKPIIWDDWIRKTSEESIEKSGLNKLVEPMVWYYNSNIGEHIYPEVWQKYSHLFPGVWVASAFKGASGPAQYLTNATRHLHNNLEWVSVMRKLGRENNLIKFHGVALTGWQRFDHFAMLCELLPVGMPSLAVCLQAMQSGGFGEPEYDTASKILHCSSKLDLGLWESDDKGGVNLMQDCSFPGSDVYYAVHQFAGILNRFKNNMNLQDQIQGWLSDYSVRRKFTHPMRMKMLAMKISVYIDELNSLAGPLHRHLTSIYADNTVEEWMEAVFEGHIKPMKEILDKAKAMLTRTTWGSRFMVSDVSQTLQNAGVIRQQQQQAGIGLQPGNVPGGWQDAQMPAVNLQNNVLRAQGPGQPAALQPQGLVHVYPLPAAGNRNPVQMPAVNLQSNALKFQGPAQLSALQPQVGAQGYNFMPQGPRAAGAFGNQGALGQMGRVVGYHNPAGSISGNLNPAGSHNARNPDKSNNGIVNPAGGLNSNFNPAGSLNSKLNPADTVNPAGNSNGSRSFADSIYGHQKPYGSINGIRLQARASKDSPNNVNKLDSGTDDGTFGNQQGGRLSETFLRRPGYPNMPSGPSKLAVGDWPAQANLQGENAGAVNRHQGQQQTTAAPESVLGNAKQLGTQFLQKLQWQGRDRAGSDRKEQQILATQPAVDIFKKAIAEGPPKLLSPFKSGGKLWEAGQGNQNANLEKEVDTRPGGTKMKEADRNGISNLAVQEKLAEEKGERENPLQGLSEKQNDQEGRKMLDSFTGHLNNTQQKMRETDQLDTLRRDSIQAKDQKDYTEYEANDDI